MRHSNISIFIPHIGCPNKCSFCNQNHITGSQSAPDINDVVRICEQAYNDIEYKSETQIAFFGGSFTAIDKKYMLSLLECVQPFIGKDKFCGIRISTRPDCIDDEILSILKKYHVTSIEFGAQSMDDDVLFYNDRGHTAQDVKKASALIKEYGFELGLQMMVGLYKSNPQLDIKTAKDIIDLSPDTVRIYPVVILKNTKLGDLFLDGKYKTYSLDDAVVLCAKIMTMFNNAGIRIIKLGLHASELVEEQMLGGIYHPAFCELCENEIFYNKILNQLNSNKLKNAKVYVSKKSLSKAIGQKKKNIIRLSDNGFNIKFLPCDDLAEYDVKIVEEEVACT